MKSTEVEFYCAKGKFMVIENNRFALEEESSTTINLRFNKLIEEKNI